MGEHARGIRLEDSAQSNFSYLCFTLAQIGANRKSEMKPCLAKNLVFHTVVSPTIVSFSPPAPHNLCQIKSRFAFSFFYKFFPPLHRWSLIRSSKKSKFYPRLEAFVSKTMHDLIFRTSVSRLPWVVENKSEMTPRPAKHLGFHGFYSTCNVMT